MLKTSLPLGLSQPHSSHSLRSGQAPYRQQTPPTFTHSRRLGRHQGFTLLEVLIATAVTMLMMLGLAQIFRVLGESMSQGRAGLELNNRLRSVMHRIRTDLDNVTVTPRPPIAVGTAQGYLKYYEGPASDYTFSLIPPLNPDTGTNELLSRFGDVDDIFMATVKAKDTWFTGKVPRFVASGKDLEDPSLTSTINASDFELVTIASQFAEIIIFAQPLVAQGRPAGYTLNDLKPERDASFLASHPEFYERTIIGGVPIDVPAGYRLHYRVLLIRPDLNRTLHGGRIGLPAHPGTDSMIVGPRTLNGVALQTPQLDMYKIYQDCDLSVRRSGNRVVANNIEDLANPANRFAHVVYGLSNGVTSMPLLALSPPMSFQGARTSIAETGFLHPAFVLHDDRTGEDVLTTDLLAFDVKAYDSGAPVIRTSDDSTTLRPGDPGFGTVEYPLPNGSNIVAHGEFVDLNWAGKLGRSFPSELSGYDSSGFPTIALFKSGLVKRSSNGFQIFQPSYDTYTNLYESDGVLQAQIANQIGLVTVTNTSGISLTEPWRTDAFDAGTDGVDNNPSVAPPKVLIAVPGVDDPSERETSPPFPVDLRGLQISVRLEDPTKKQFKQMSTVKQFVTN